MPNSLTANGFPVMLSFDLDAETMWTGRDPKNAARPVLMSQGAYGWKVGVPRIDALVMLHDTVQSNRDWISPNLGIGQPLIKPKGIDDVPVVTLTLWSRDGTRGAYELERVAHAAETWRRQ